MYTLLKTPSLSIAKQVAQGIVDRSPLFHLRVSGDELHLCDPIIEQMPSYVKSNDAIYSWLLCKERDRAGYVAISSDGVVAMKVSHAVADGTHVSDILTSLDHPSVQSASKRIECLEAWELLSKSWKGGDQPSVLPGDVLLAWRWSHRPRAYAFRSSKWNRFPVQDMHCFNKSTQDPVQALEHLWASLLICGLAHNWRKTGEVVLSHSGIGTLVDCRQGLSVTNPLALASCFGGVDPHAGAVRLGETLESITKRMLRTMKEEIQAGDAVWFIRFPQPVSSGPVVGSPVSFSHNHPFVCPRDILDLDIWQSWHDPGEVSRGRILVTDVECKFADGRRDVLAGTAWLSSIYSDEDSAMVHEQYLRCVKNLGLKCTVREALTWLHPGIKV